MSEALRLLNLADNDSFKTRLIDNNDGSDRLSSSFSRLETPKSSDAEGWLSRNPHIFFNADRLKPLQVTPRLNGVIEDRQNQEFNLDRKNLRSTLQISLDCTGDATGVRENTGHGTDHFQVNRTGIEIRWRTRT